MTEIETKLMDDALQGLGEHFDSVQIFVTRHEAGEKGGTLAVKRGCGNIYARYGQIREWLIEQDEGVRVSTPDSSGTSET
jgi:hypothetical protein